ncbi:MAG: FMN-binding glutamate synthase family protein [Myxococcota bacterium]
MSPRGIFLASSALALGGVAGLFTVAPVAATVVAVLVVPVVLLGLYDMVQTRHTIRRNFPVIGHGRYLLEMIRPEINQYFIESDTDGTPYPRERRSLVYQRAKGVRDTVPFGTQQDVYAAGYEWMNHSMLARAVHDANPRVIIGSAACRQPYEASVFNVGAMSYGALSGAAVRSLSRGAADAGFALNTGEGGISEHHRQGSDLIWQIGTGYFGARTPEGDFDPERFAETASDPAVKMIEENISQGAKPGHGGILPASKLTAKIAAVRGVPMGKDVISPPGHTAFRTPLELVLFMDRLRELSGGKPVGIKLCVGKHRELFCILKAMLVTGAVLDFITVDGAEGGTGAAPLELTNSVGTPLVEGLVFVHNALVGTGLRDQVKLLASGRVTTGFDLARLLAIGADGAYAARAMLFAIGCIQARRCNSNDCPTGVATQDPALERGLVVSDKATRVAQYHRATVKAFAELVGAAGLEGHEALRPWHIHRRVGPTKVQRYDEIYEYVEPGAFLGDEVPERYARAWHAARAEGFERDAVHHPTPMVVLAS